MILQLWIETVDGILVNILQVQPLTESEQESAELLGFAISQTTTEVRPNQLEETFISNANLCDKVNKFLAASQQKLSSGFLVASSKCTSSAVSHFLCLPHW